jgi:hypothetical protein
MRRFITLAAVLVLSLTPIPAGAAPSGSSANFPARIDLPDGFFPEGIESGPGTSFFVGSLVDGAIWRGDLRTGSSSELAAGAPGRASLGIAYDAGRNRLWVAGGGPAVAGTADVRVYDASSGNLLATYQPQAVGLLNDVALTPDAVYVTDSFLQQLVVIPLPADGSLAPDSDTVTLPLTGDLVSTSGFNLNGIVSQDGVLVVAQSSTGKLFRVNPATGITDQVDLGGVSLGSPDGLQLLGHTLYAVSNAENLVNVVSLGSHLASGVVLGQLTDPGLDFPATATVAAGRLWAVNLRFSTPPGPQTAYWITQLPLRP